MPRARQRGTGARKLTKRLTAMGGGVTTSGVEFVAYKFGVKFLQNSYISGGITGVLGAGLGFVAKEGSHLESYGDGMLGAASARVAETALWKFGLMNGFAVNGFARETISALGQMADTTNGMEFDEKTIDGWFDDYSDYEEMADDEMS